MYYKNEYIYKTTHTHAHVYIQYIHINYCRYADRTLRVYQVPASNRFNIRGDTIVGLKYGHGLTSWRVYFQFHLSEEGLGFAGYYDLYRVINVFSKEVIEVSNSSKFLIHTICKIVILTNF